MKKPFKRLLFLGAAFLIVLSLLLHFATVNFLKSTVIAKVRAYTGTSVSINGDMTLAFWPGFALNIEQVVLANPAGFGDQPLAELQHLSLGLAFMPLFKQQAQLNALNLTGLRLHLIKNKSGQDNWTAFHQQGQATQPITPADLPAKANADVALRINAVNVAEASVTYQDQQTAREFILSAMNVSFDHFAVAEVLHFNASAALQENQSTLSHQLQMHGQVEFAPKFDRINLTELQLENRVSGEKIPGTSLQLTAALRAGDYNVLAQQFKAEGLNLQWQNLLLSVEGNADFGHEKPLIRASLHLDDPKLRESLLKQGIPLPATQDQHVFSGFKADIQFESNTQDIKATLVNVTLDQSQLKGSAVWHWTDPEALSLNAELDDIKLDRYLSTENQAPLPVLSSVIVLEASDRLLTSWLDISRLKLDGNILLHRVSLNHLDLQDVNLLLQSQSGSLRAQEKIQQLYSGRYQGQMSIHNEHQVSHLTLDESFSQIAVGPLLSAAHQRPWLEGRMDASLRLNAQGQDVAALKASMNGELNLAMQGLTLKSFAQQQQIAALLTPIKSMTTLRNLLANDWHMDTLTAHAELRQGVLENHDLLAKMPDLTLKGEGKLDLNTALLDYRFKAQPAAAESPLSILLSGDVRQPSFKLEGLDTTVDMKAVELQEKTNKLLHKLDKVLGKQVGQSAAELLKKLF